ncbi:Ubiquitin-fold modifier-conjugating enzyme 1 [Galemys pyrenaicus]|uniref:Ubiquitin-fold modifier-conjugating enzyme 1 n=1 Tax=Galemys pyrenaicus TaxID=202257 RepID=A0A8J5ZLT1_GALPY|nr:Ubiquitin-fold modifier-conjugating enzyme 1 [Galemys pyrenaicus]
MADEATRPFVSEILRRVSVIWKCWYFHDLLKYEFDIEFYIPITYPTTAPEIAVPELDGKTEDVQEWQSMSDFQASVDLDRAQVWTSGSGASPWLVVESPDVIQKDAIQHEEKCIQ